MICTHCGKRIPNNSLICPLCDALQVGKNKKVCRFCGALMDMKFNICPVCRQAQNRSVTNGYRRDETRDREEVPDEGYGGGYDEDYDEGYGVAEGYGEDDAAYPEERQDAPGRWRRILLIVLGLLLVFALGFLAGRMRLPFSS